MPTLPLVFLAKEASPTRRKIRTRTEGMRGVISCEHDNADAIISVQDIIGGDQVTHDWNSDRVALLRSVEFNDGDRAV
jgi:hypothetical protein